MSRAIVHCLLPASGLSFVVLIDVTQIRRRLGLIFFCHTETAEGNPASVETSPRLCDPAADSLIDRSMLQASERHHAAPALGHQRQLSRAQNQARWGASSAFGFALHRNSRSDIVN